MPFRHVLRVVDTDEVPEYLVTGSKFSLLVEFESQDQENNGIEKCDIVPGSFFKLRDARTIIECKQCVLMEDNLADISFELKISDKSVVNSSLLRTGSPLNFIGLNIN